MSRLPPLDLQDLTPEQKRVADEIQGGPRGGLRGPFEAWLRSPGLADHAQRLGAYCRFGTELPPDVVELAILLTGKHWKAQFEFWAHARLARTAGLPADAIEAIRTGATPQLEREDLAAAYDTITEYFRTNRLSAATYKRALDTFGERGLVDLIGIAGYYGLVSMTLNIFEVPVPPGETEPLQ
ncbi:MAG: carboxymuconolactone decarboxylase family protein [Chloroflexi bacterium]|nr:carboxymuconolactone decarboxylase family protein [Chloroflexota bacterium]